MNHLTDKQLELWVRSKENFDPDEAASISEHLESCHHCKEKLAALQAYYHDLESEINKSPSEKERAIALKIYQGKTKKALPEGTSNQIYQNLLEAPRNSLSLKIKTQLQKHPIRSASITIGTFLLAALVLIVQPWEHDTNNPIYAKVERNVLHVYNQEGESIWSKVADGIPNETNSERGSRRYIRIADIDGDDTNEVLITGKGIEGDFTQNKLYCFNGDGTLRWEQSPPHPIMFGENTLSKVMTWDVTDFFVLQSSDNDTRLFATSNSSWSPSVLFEMNPINGELLQTYWHPGWIWTSKIYKKRNNGRPFILLGTTNNTYQKAALAVLDPDNIDGYAPLPESARPKKISRADEVHYIMFKPSLLNQFYSEQLYNRLSEIQITPDGSLLVDAEEKWDRIDASGAVLYTIDKSFTVLGARGSSTYDKIYRDHHRDGELDKPLTDQYWESLKASVLYWDESTSSFVRGGQLEE